MNNEMLSEKELNALDAKEVRISDKRLHEKGVVYLGQTWGPYGNFDYYKLNDGSYVFTYYSIGD